MHCQVLVIRPRDVKLEDVMYRYQEIDKRLGERMADERCEFIQTIEESEIQDTLLKIHTKLEERTNECLEELKYRSEHSLEEYKEKYGKDFNPHTFDIYKYNVDGLMEYDKVKDLPHDDLRQITFIKDNSIDIDKFADIYIKDLGYGSFDNPYRLWDFYTIVNEHRFPKDIFFLIGKDGTKSNEMQFNRLDIDKTVENINEYTSLWEHIIFCKDNSASTRLFTIDNICFGYPHNRHLLVDDLKEVLTNLSEEFTEEKYIISAIDLHR